MEILNRLAESIDYIEKHFDQPLKHEEIAKIAYCSKFHYYIGPLGFLGVCMDFNDQADTFNYVIGVEKTTADTPAGCVEKPIPAATWAVFEAIGPVNPAVQATWERIFSEWFPATGYELVNAPQYEAYPKDGDIMAQDHITEIWIPVVKKKI
ncbi:hypothetical protein BTA31_12410 [Bacillus haynesii]|uniref:AraC effector-binding domain-containing protein n=1 Tax=Bacillus haynesii TaxID=1925021 RepID=A0ABX3I4K3_9BACI|nr:GyrI-like domain-containing protein [Bacillus haynesii]OMI27290.1 hypothetical protein BTA31_12410 [Bacillus haynesii]